MRNKLRSNAYFARSVVALLCCFGIGPVAARPLATERTSRTAILCAYKPECQAILPIVADRQEEGHAGVRLVSGQIDGTPVILVESGVSMVNATMAAQIAIDRYRIDKLIVMGISGGANPDLHVGDVVIPDGWSEYLESVFARENDGHYVLPSYFAVPQERHFGMIFPQPVHVPRSTGMPELRWSFPVDHDLLEAARRISSRLAFNKCTAGMKCLETTPRLVVGGGGVSGPAFIDNAAFREFAHRTFHADVLDMEAAAVAQVAYMNGVPFLAIRSLSDLAGGDADANQMEAFQELASGNAVAVLVQLLKQLEGTP